MIIFDYNSVKELDNSEISLNLLKINRNNEN